jgi:hypothetical protein
MKNKITVKSNNLLAVEGKDECNFFKAVLEYENINNIQVIDIGGKDKFKIEFPLLINSEGFSEVHALGFVRDAEEDQALSAFSSICGILKKNGLPVPKIMNSINNERNMKIGVFIMPNNIDEGMLEDLCLESVKTKPVFECVNEYIKCCLSDLSEDEKNINVSKAKIGILHTALKVVYTFLQDIPGKRKQDSRKCKAGNERGPKIQTYLASKKPIVNSLGLAATKGYWDFEENCFSEIKQFLHSLFSE